MLAKHDRKNNVIKRNRDPFGLDDILDDDFFVPFRSVFSDSPFTIVRSYGYDSYRSVIDADGMTVDIDIPGVAKETLEVTIQDDSLVVEGTRGDKKVKRVYSLDDRFERQPSSATVADGVLTLRFELLPQLKPRAPIKVEVK
jgi:HSP20 family molecular chaperone IbpA